MKHLFYQRRLPVLTIVLLAMGVVALSAKDIDAEIRGGIEELYNVRFDEAARSFDRAIASDPGDPRGYFYRANVHLWGYLFDNRPDQLARFMAVSDKGIKAAERRLSANPKDNVAKLFLGMSYGYRAISNARAENFMAAALSAKSCYDKLNEVVRSDPKMYDAYLGLGIFHFIFGSVPQAGQFLAGVGGFKGDAQLGIREIESVAARGKYFSNDARLIVALLNIYHKNDLERGLGVLRGMSDRYPRNVAILYAIGAAYLDQHQPDKAIPYLEKIASQGNKDFKTFTAMSYGRCGIAYFQKNDFKRAKGYLQNFLKTSDEKMFRAYGWYMLGVCYEMEGNRANAVKAYDRSVKSSTFKSPEDRSAQRRAKKLVTTPLSEIDRQILLALNAAASSRPDDARRFAGVALGHSKLTSDQRAQGLFVLGRSQQMKGSYSEAVTSFSNALKAGEHEETWVKPFSHYYLAESYLKLGNKEKSQDHLKRARSFHGYDNEMTLRFKLDRDVTMID